MPPQAKTDTKYGIMYTILRESDNNITAFVDIESNNDTFDTWNAAEKWAHRMIEETRVNRKRINEIERNKKDSKVRNIRGR